MTFYSSKRLRIPTNQLLRGGEQTIDLDNILALRNAVRGSSDIQSLSNLRLLSKTDFERIHSVHGGAGLFKTSLLAAKEHETYFSHFINIIFAELTAANLAIEEQELSLDNGKLSQLPKLSEFNWNLIQPSLSRKLYHPGTGRGYIVYGLGDPRILVSHPYKGLKGETYDPYINASDVVTSLLQDGYHGSFLFFDFLPGLNFEVNGVPAWLLWFSIVAAHSDLVLFVKERLEDFRASQISEIGFTPPRVPKKIVEVPKLQWAKEPEIDGNEEIIYGGPDGMLTKEEFYKLEADFAKPFINLYASSGLPKDRWLILSESGDLAELPFH